MVRSPSPGLVDAARLVVPVRVTDMKGVDLNVFRFDWDLTFAALVMHADGTIYHQYGNRTPADAEARLSMESMERLVRGSFLRHTEYMAAPRENVEPAPARTVEMLPTMRRRVESGKPPDCFHCHFVYQGIDEEAREAGTFDPAVAWRWPPATRIGIHLDRDDQTLVRDVDAKSPAAKAGLRAGDVLVRVGGRAVLTEGDVQWVLEDVPGSGGSVPIVFRRGDEESPRTGTLKLGKGWRVGEPEELWRPTMWRLDPKPGFGGPMLSAEEKERLGIDADVSAFRVNYIVTWGDEAETGRRAQDAGIRKGDIVLSADGKQDFRSPQHFQAWFRLTRKEGRPVPFRILRGDRQLTVTLWGR